MSCLFWNNFAKGIESGYEYHTKSIEFWPLVHNEVTPGLPQILAVFERGYFSRRSLVSPTAVETRPDGIYSYQP